MEKDRTDLSVSRCPIIFNERRDGPMGVGRERLAGIGCCDRGDYLDGGDLSRQPLHLPVKVRSPAEKCDLLVCDVWPLYGRIVSFHVCRAEYRARLNCRAANQ